MSSFIKRDTTFYVAQSPRSGFVPMYRAFDGSNHYYTANGQELQSLRPEWRFVPEGAAFYVRQTIGPGFVLLLRFYSGPGRHHDHRYVASAAAPESLVTEGWRSECVNRDRIKAHVLLCWLALLLIRVTENETNDTWGKLKQTLWGLMAGQHRTQHGIITQTSTLTPGVKSVLDALNLKLRNATRTSPDPTRPSYTTPRHPRAKEQREGRSSCTQFVPSRCRSRALATGDLG